MNREHDSDTRSGLNVDEIVRQVWSEHIAEAGTDANDHSANFFALGGNSLGAARMMATLSERLDHRLGMRLLTRNPTLRELSAAVRQSLTEGAAL